MGTVVGLGAECTAGSRPAGTWWARHARSRQRSGENPAPPRSDKHKPIERWPGPRLDGKRRRAQRCVAIARI